VKVKLDIVTQQRSIFSDYPELTPSIAATTQTIGHIQQ